MKASARVSDFEDIDDIQHRALLAGSPERSWIWFGLIVSLCLHLTLCIWFYRTRFMSVETVFADTQQPMTFRVKPVDLSQIDKASGDQISPASKPNPDDTKEQRPDEKKSFDKLLQEIQATTQMPDDMSNALPEKPKVDQPDVTSVMNEIERSSAQTLSTSPNATHEQSALNDSSVSGRPQPALSGTELATSTIIKRPNTFTSKLPGDSAGPNKKGAPGFSDLDQLLSQKGPLGSGTKIRMPEDQLFSFDSAELQPGDILQKLVDLLKRNPNVRFTIEGYTDSIGTPDYNLDLSQRRADNMKYYLAQALGIDPSHIDAVGRGSTKFVVPPRLVSLSPGPALDAEIQRESPNRRVEVTINTNPQ
ncbi:MAG TPA: OmpA family protein [Chthoniobacterales bacterium]|nr:OmpA family protein [Chthoniobacterales bacterium]